MTTRLLFGARKNNGQIAFLSNDLTLPELADIFKSKGDIKVIVNYYPIIEAIHNAQKIARKDEIQARFNALYRYWEDSKTHGDSPGIVRHMKFETLSNQANSLLAELEIKIQKSESPFYEEVGKHYSHSQALKSIKSDSEIYIETLLCYIHSKASTNINSFRTDTTLTNYGNSLQDVLLRMYKWLISGSYYPQSLLKYLAFGHGSDKPKMDQKLEQYLALEGIDETPDEFRLRVIDESPPTSGYDDQGQFFMQTGGRWQPPKSEYLQAVDTIKDLLFKIGLVNEFLARLRAGELVWEDDDSSVDELKRELLRLNHKS